jgi:hypothetical protein
MKTLTAEKAKLRPAIHPNDDSSVEPSKELRCYNKLYSCDRQTASIFEIGTGNLVSAIIALLCAICTSRWVVPGVKRFSANKFLLTWEKLRHVPVTNKRAIIAHCSRFPQNPTTQGFFMEEAFVCDAIRAPFGRSSR